MFLESGCPENGNSFLANQKLMEGMREISSLLKCLRPKKILCLYQTCWMLGQKNGGGSPKQAVHFTTVLSIYG